jgi:hypothetical protein
MSLTFNSVTEIPPFTKALKLSLISKKGHGFFWKNEEVKKQHAYFKGTFNVYMYKCTMVLYKCMKSLGMYGHSFSGNTHVQSKICQEFSLDNVYIANEGPLFSIVHKIICYLFFSNI